MKENGESLAVPEDIVLLGQAIEQNFGFNIDEDISKLYGQAGRIIGQYAALMEENPKDALARTSEYLDKVRAVNSNQAYTEAIAGGPNQDWIAPILDIAGSRYAEAPKSTRKVIIQHHLGYLDKLNYTYSQDHVAMLHNPLVVRDILFNNVLYWPGYAYQKAFLQRPGVTWDDFNLFILTESPSPVFAGLALSKAEYGSREIKDRFYKEAPDLLDGVLDLVAGITFRDSTAVAENGSDVVEEAEQLISKYDHVLHHRIRQKLAKADWLILPNRPRVPELAKTTKLKYRQGELTAVSKI